MILILTVEVPMTTEEILKDANARSIIEWAYRAGQYDCACASAQLFNGQQLVYQGHAHMMTLKDFKRLVINTEFGAESVMDSIRIMRGD